MKAEDRQLASKLLDWAFKALLGLTLYLVRDMYADVKYIREQVPAMKVEIENLKDQRLLDKFKALKVTGPMKEEQTITYDSLTKTHRI